MNSIITIKCNDWCLKWKRNNWVYGKENVSLQTHLGLNGEVDEVGIQQNLICWTQCIHFDLSSLNCFNWKNYIN
jgi:hypothetical protein